MLTIKEPIKLNNRDIVTHGGEGFFHRITDNYSLIDSEITSQDLVDAITLPPEIFYQEGEQVNILNNNVSYIKNQQEKIEIINRLINRLAVSAYTELTYQDKVYISSVIRKLGIKNEQKFMSQILKITENIDNTHKELNFLEEATRIIQETETEKVQSQRESINPQILDSIEKSASIHLYNEIFKRLNTEKVYEEFINYNNSLRRNEYITARTLKQTDFGKTVEFLKMQRLQEGVLGQPVSLSYRFDETLTEENLEELFSESKEEMMSEVTKVILLSLFDEVYEGLKQEKYSSSDYVYLHNELQGAVENALLRYQQTITGPVYNMAENAPVVNYAVHEVVSYPEVTEETVEESVSVEEQILETLNRYDQKNIENQNIYIRALSEAQKKMKKSSRPTGDAQRMRRESLRALENPDEMLSLYSEEEAGSAEQIESIKKEIVQELPEEVRQYVEMINRFFVNPGPEERRILTSQDAMTSLLTDINAAEMALPENPYVMEEPDEETREERLSEMQQVLNAIQNIKESGDEGDTYTDFSEVTEQNITELMQVAKEAEMEHRRSETPPSEETVVEPQKSESAQIQNLTGTVKNIIENMEEGDIHIHVPGEGPRVSGNAKTGAVMEHRQGDTYVSTTEVSASEAGKNKQSFESAQIEHPERATEEAHSETPESRSDKRAELQSIVNAVTNIRQSFAEGETHIDYSDLSEENIRELTQVFEEATLEHPEGDDSSNTETSRLPRNAEELVDEVINRTSKRTSKINEEEEKHTGISLIHKNNERIDEEEILELIDEQRRMIEQNRTQIVENRESVNVVNRNTTSTQVVNETHVDEDKIYRIVKESISGSMGELSEQVYSKLERKLSNEKKRRGL